MKVVFDLNKTVPSMSMGTVPNCRTFKIYLYVIV